MSSRTRIFSWQAVGLVVVLMGTTVSCSVPPSDSSVSLDAKTTRRLACSDWRVRYCLATENRVGSATDRVVLEQLIRDPNESVANQASIKYLSTFIRVDTAFLREHVSLYSRLPSGGDRAEMPDITSADFHRSELGGDVENPAVGPSIQVIGVIGSKEDALLLRPFAKSKNAYVALVAAIAICRLGHEREGVEALKRLVERPISSGHLFYQVESLRLLAEVDAKYFKSRLPILSIEAKSQKCTTPAHWWRLTEIAWSRGLEIN